MTPHDPIQAPGWRSLPLPDWDGSVRNLVFLGEAGCGKSEVAVNAALNLASMGERRVHFFDLDMTKPLFRSRDAAGVLAESGVVVHFEDQFMDVPTTVGGPGAYLQRTDCLCVLDVGGDYAGARSVGQYASVFRSGATAVYYVINPYRPWSGTTARIDAVLSDILSVTHLSLEDLRLVGNPNLGPSTTAEEFSEGCRILAETVLPYRPVAFYCARREIAVNLCAPGPVMELRLLFPYPWSE